MRTGKNADLQKCLERSPLGSGNADQEEVLVVETNNTDYEETVDPVTDDITIEELSDLSVELSLNLVRRKRNSNSVFLPYIFGQLQSVEKVTTNPKLGQNHKSRSTEKSRFMIAFIVNLMADALWLQTRL